MDQGTKVLVEVTCNKELALRREVVLVAGFLYRWDFGINDGKQQDHS